MCVTAMGGKGKKGVGRKGPGKGNAGGKASQNDAPDNASAASSDDLVDSYHHVEFASDGSAKLWFVELHSSGWQEWRLDCNSLCTDP